MTERPVAYTDREGGEWVPYPEVADMPVVHAIKCSNGAIWDQVNGWRKNVRVRVKMNRAVVKK